MLSRRILSIVALLSVDTFALDLFPWPRPVYDYSIPNNSAQAGAVTSLYLRAGTSDYDRRPFKLFLTLYAPEGHIPCTLENSTVSYIFAPGATEAVLNFTIPQDVGPSGPNYELSIAQLLRDNGAWDDTAKFRPPSVTLENTTGRQSSSIGEGILSWYGIHNWLSCRAVGCARTCAERFNRPNNNASSETALYDCVKACDGAFLPPYDVFRRSQTEDVVCESPPGRSVTTTSCTSTSSAAPDTTITIGHAVTTIRQTGASTTASTTAITTSSITGPLRANSASLIAQPSYWIIGVATLLLSGSLHIRF